jgi:uncharacterized protein involved in exopolysaccharide biosynthesis
VIDSIGPTVIYPDLVEKETGTVGNLRNKVRELVNGFKILIRSWKNEFQGAAESSLGDPSSLSNRDIAFLLVNKNLEVVGIRDSRVIEITFKNKDPQIAAIVLGKLIEVYLEIRPQIHKNTETYAFFQEQSLVLKNKVRQIEDELKAFKKQYDIIALDEERSLLLKKKADLQGDMNTSLSQKVETENRIRQIMQQLDATPQKIQQGETSNMNPYLINTLEERLVTLELKEKELLTKYTDNNQLVRQVKDELHIVRQKLKEYENKRFGSASFGPNPTYVALQEALNQNKTDLEALNGKIQIQMTHLGDYTERLSRLNQVEYKLDELQNELEVNQKNYHLYMTKYEEDRISNEMDHKNLANVSVIKPSQLPLEPESPTASLILALGLVLAFFGSVVTALFLEFLNDRLERPEDIENFLQTPVLASIAEYRH